MNLGDYIGDTRTESLPPGFLKSIKIKYRHEASHVFAGLPPCTRQNEAARQIESVVEATPRNKDGSKEEDMKNDGQNVQKDLPSFMSWRIPSRLLNQKCEKTSPGEESDKNSIAKSASNISRHLTATTVRSLTSIALKRGSKRSELKESQSKDETKSLVKPRGTRENTSSKITGGKSSNRYSNIDNKKQKGNDKHINSANSRMLKPITLELNRDHSSTFKEGDQLHNKRESHANFQKNLNEEKAVAHSNLRIKTTASLSPQKKVPNKNAKPLVVNSSKEVNSNHKAQMMDDDMQRSTPEYPNGRQDVEEDTIGVDQKKLSNRSLRSANEIGELPEMKDSLTKRKQLNPQNEENDNVLPMLKATESRGSIKLSQTPERMGKIHDWMKKSTSREREAAFSLLSAYNNSENIQSKTPKKNQRVRIALQILERKRLPDPIRPLQLNNINQSPNVMRLDQKTLENYSSQINKKEEQGMKTWHRMPMYHHMNTINNRSALFVQPSKVYQRHFSIHPEWGLHHRVKLTL